MSDPLRPPFHSFTTTPLMLTTGCLSKTWSSCLARSPQSVTVMLMPESSATVISRFVNSLPSLDVNENVGRKLAMTPHSSTVHGNALDCKVRRSVRGASNDIDSDVRLTEEPLFAHHCCKRWTSGNFGCTCMTPASIKEPLRPLFHSLTATPFRQITGLPSKTLSSCFARSPQRAMERLVAVSSASVISRFTSSLPSLEVKARTGLKPTTTPQRSTVQGAAFDCTAWRSTKENLMLSILASSAASSMRASLSKTSS
mmetsp:Transcript_114103/g.285450  ORF Transcript_114103/g.285450 Transcript_114103/m.285450 type:complete len:256 (+) Transcript_114103:793-1560(+)